MLILNIHYLIQKLRQICGGKICIYPLTLVKKLLLIRYSCYLPNKAIIGKGLVLPHGLSGIFITGNAVIGTNCTIFQNVTIGRNNDVSSKGYGSPIIGNNVLLGAGSIIIGKCSIGNNVKIGAGVVVSFDVPDNATVEINKPRIILK